MPTASAKILNHRHILIHMFAIYFMQQAFIDFACLIHADYLETLPLGDGAPAAADRMRFLLFVGLYASIGSLVGFLISGVVGFIRKWFWLNTLMAFIAFWVVNNFVFTQIGLSTLLLKTGKVIGDLSLFYGFLVLLMLAISLVLFFYKPVKLFIEDYRKVPVLDKQ